MRFRRFCPVALSVNWSTCVSDGIEIVPMFCCSVMENSPSMIVRLGADNDVSMPLGSMTKFSVMRVGGIEISVASVATAMEPEYVWQAARGDASAVLVIVRVPEVLQAL